MTMIDITKAQANQTTTNGINGEWTITLDGEILYRLPENFTVQDTFLIRDIIEQMMSKASEEMRKQEQQLCLVKMNKVVANGDAQLDSLKRENIRLSETLENLIGEDA